MMYILVSVVEREIMACPFVGKKNALEQMRKELLQQIHKNNAPYSDEEVYFGLDNGEIGLKYDSAYSNLDDNQNWDWFIIGINPIEGLGLTHQETIWMRELLDTERIQHLGIAKHEHLSALGSPTNDLATMHEMNADAHKVYAKKLETFHQTWAV